MPKRVQDHCNYEGCGNPHLAKGWCKKHYGRLYKTGSVELSAHTKGNCTVDGCEASSYSNGLCKKHDARMYRGWADPEYHSIKTCPHCGVEFKSMNSMRIYCSKSHSVLADRKRNPERYRESYTRNNAMKASRALCKVIGTSDDPESILNEESIKKIFGVRCEGGGA